MIFVMTLLFIMLLDVEGFHIFGGGRSFCRADTNRIFGHSRWDEKLTVVYDPNLISKPTKSNSIVSYYSMIDFGTKN